VEHHTVFGFHSVIMSTKCLQFYQQLYNSPSVPASQLDQLMDHLEQNCECFPRFSFHDERHAPTGVGKDVVDDNSFYNIYSLQEAKDKCVL